MPAGRRSFLKRAAACGLSLALPRSVEAAVFRQAPALVTRDAARPQMPSGIQIGDVLSDRAIIWSRADRPARFIVEHSLRADFGGAVRVPGPIAVDTAGYTARLDVTGLPADRELFVRVSFEDVSSGRAASAPATGRLRTAPTTRRDVTFLWSADTAGQGYGISPNWGMKLYETMRAIRPDFFIHCGDTIYADVPIPAELRLADGTVWTNIVTDETSRVAESLADFRGRYAYNLMDENVRRFSSEVPQIWQWDDHEVMNNWSDSKDLSRDSRYAEKNVRRLARRGRRAFLEYAPMRYHGADDADRIYRRIAYGPLLDVFMIDCRTYRGPNGGNRQPTPGPDTAFLGEPQLAWLKQELRRSRALWKVIASDMPIGLIVRDDAGPGANDRFEGVANGNGPVCGREFEFVDLFRFIKQHRVRNVVWITGDVHYTAAHYYDPQSAQFDQFEPFWEFVSGPLHAGTFGPSALDNTFGPKVVFQKASPTPSAPPSAGLQFFGQMDIDGKTGTMTVTLKDLAGASLYVNPLAPSPA
jgi:alkaline phosphatase D